MKAVLLKSTSPSTLTKDLRNYIAAEYGVDTVTEVEHFLEKISTHRQDLVSSSGFSTVEGSITRLTTWLGIINILDRWLSSTTGKTTFPSSFRWNDCLQRTHWEERRDIRWEKICVLHNYGALLSYTGCTAVGNKTTDGMKLAIKNFQIAAGVFVYLRDSVMPTILDTVTRDLRDPVLSQHINLLLAQAEQCCYEKACTDKLAPSLLSKLSVGVANFYEAAHTNARLSVRGYLEPEMIAWLNVHSLSFRAAGHFHKAVHDNIQVEEKSLGYGYLICRLSVARKLLDTCHEAIQANGLVGDLDELTNKVTKWLNQLVKDNQFVYVELIPSVDALEELKGLQNVTATKFTESDVALRDDAMETAFLKLTPIKVKAMLHHLTDRCTRIQTPLNHKLNTISVMRKQILVEDKDTIDSVRYMTNKGVVLSDECWHTILMIQELGGVGAAEGLMEALESSSVAAQSRLQKLSTDTQQHMRDSTRDELSHLISELQSKLQTAKRANADVAAKLNTVKKYGAYMQLPRDCLNTRLKQKTSEENREHSDSNGTNSERSFALVVTDVEDLQETCDRAKQSMQERLTVDVDALRDALMKDDLPTEVKNSRMDCIADDYNDFCNSLVLSTEESSKSIFANFKLQLAELEFERRHTSPTNVAAARLLSDIEVASSATLTGLTEASDGRQFFKDLHDRVEQVADKVDAWIASEARRVPWKDVKASAYGSFNHPYESNFRL
eukprot:Lankesteria_metandrocarpae@DN2013_c0_g1_i1.p1